MLKQLVDAEVVSQFNINMLLKEQTITIDPVGGQLRDILTTDEIEMWATILKKAPIVAVRNNLMAAVDENNNMYGMFKKYCFSKIQSIFGEDLELIFGMLLQENTPWKIHTDAYHCIGFDDRMPAISFLIPYSVDDNKDLIDRVHTIVFNEHGATEDELVIEDKTHRSDSASLIYDMHLSHNSRDRVNALTVQGIYKWHPNSIIYWNSMHFHDSDNYIKNGFTQKKAIVIHTYRKKE